MEFIISILVSGAAFFIGAKLLSGVYLRSFTSAIILAIVFALLNATLGTVLKVMSLGLLSLLSWVLNAILIIVADKFMDSFEVKNFWWALGLAAIVSIMLSIVGYSI